MGDDIARGRWELVAEREIWGKETRGRDAEAWGKGLHVCERLQTGRAAEDDLEFQ